MLKQIGLSLLLFAAVTPRLTRAAPPSDPWADAVVDYVEGAGVGPGFNDPSTALGTPTRFTGPTSPFGGPVTPFNPPFGADEVVTVGEGGSLTVRFDVPVTDDPRNPFGIDLLVFGNAFLSASDFPVDPTSVVTDFSSAEGGELAISDDGVDFTQVAGIEADGLFPPAGYTDFDSTVASDFTRPVNPSYDAGELIGLTTDQLLDLYDGSAGGAGIDIAALGFAEISFVRITNPLGSGVTPEIDALVDVRALPEPASGTTCPMLLAMIGALRRRLRAR